MNPRIRVMTLLSLSGLFAAITVGQDAPAPNPSAPAPQPGQMHVRDGQMNGERPVFGKITTIQDGTIELTGADGQAVTVKVTKDTEFRKDRQPAKASDFKVGDLIMVRGDQNPDHSVTAKIIGGRTGGAMMAGPGGGPGGGGMLFGGGTLGKDFVMGEVKAIDPPRITVLRTDNVTQTLELNEDTTLRRGRESITMADIQVGDHLVAHGALQNNVFVPKGVMVMTAEQWQRMQDFAAQVTGGKPVTEDKPAPKP